MDRPLVYEIHSYSSSSAGYSPQNILSSTPASTSARWSTRTTTNEYIILALPTSPVLLQSITFGKHHRVHPCNLANFVIYLGTRPEKKYMTQVLRAQLKNDVEPETFKINFELDGYERPVKYIRIEVLDAHSPNFNISIWHISLQGNDDERAVKSVTETYEKYRSRRLNASLLSYLRSSRSLLPTYTSLYRSLATSSDRNAQATIRDFEHPLLTSLHTTLVVEGDFERAEEIVRSAFLEQGLGLEWDSGRGGSTGEWKRLSSPAKDGGVAPSGRGGHQLVLVNRKLLCFGGWDGKSTNFNDLWEWSVDEEVHIDGSDSTKTNRDWNLLQGNTTDSSDRPQGRSCAQFVLDHSTGWCYLLGGIVTPATTTPVASPIDIPTRVVSAGPNPSPRYADSAMPEVVPTSVTALAPRSSLIEESFNSMRTFLAGEMIRINPAPRGTAAIEDSNNPGRDRVLLESYRQALENPATAASLDENILERDIPLATESVDQEMRSIPEAEGPTSAPTPPPAKTDTVFGSDFWRYKAFGARAGSWEMICSNTATVTVGGPQVIYDHQMVIDAETQKLYVFGGKFVDMSPSAVSSRTSAGEGDYSPFFIYNIAAQTWSCPIRDPPATTPARPGTSLSKLLSRAGHSMFLETSEYGKGESPGKRLVIVGGQRGKDYLNDKWFIYLSDTRNDQFEFGSSGLPVKRKAKSSPPPPDHLQPIVMDTILDKPHFTVFVGEGILPGTFTARVLPSSSSITLSQDTPMYRRDRLIKADAERQQLTCITGLIPPTLNGPAFESGSKSTGDDETTLKDVWRQHACNPWQIVSGAQFVTTSDFENQVAGFEDRPRSRYASAVVYDPIGKTYFMMGGNPISKEDPTSRLDDLWQLKITDTTPTEALRLAQFLIRKQRFAELCETHSTLHALDYLQTHLSPIVSSTSTSESGQLAECMSSLLSAPPENNLAEDETMAELTPDSSIAQAEISLAKDEHVYAARMEMWTALIELFDADVSEPMISLPDLVVS